MWRNLSRAKDLLIFLTLMPKGGILMLSLVPALCLTGLTISNSSITFKVCSFLLSLVCFPTFKSYPYDGTGKWVDFHLLDAVRLLDGKGNLVMSESFYGDCTVLFLSSLWPFPHSVKTGFTCYWTSSTHLWRITECYFDVYETWHGWSNVACVHRSYSILAKRMEDRFISTLTSID